MGTIRDSVLPDLDQARGIIDSLGLRRVSLTIRRRSWSGGVPGMGTSTDTDLHITPAPRVRGPGYVNVGFATVLFERGEFFVDRITPAYNTGTLSGGYTPAQLAPVPGPGEECFYILTGDDGVPYTCTLLEGTFTRPMGYALHLREHRESPG